MAEINSFEDLNRAKGFKIVHLNVRSLTKKMDQIRTLMHLSNIDVLTLSETWLKSHLHSNIYNLDSYTSYRLDRAVKSNRGKRGGGLITYINDKHSSVSESLEDLNVSDEHIEAQWLLIHRPHCKNIVIGNIYRPPSGNLKSALKYLDECLKVINISKVDVYLIGDLNVNYKNKSSPDYKKLHFFSQSNGLSQYIEKTTRNTDKTKSLIDLALTNSKFVSDAGTLEHFVSDHQPIFINHKKGKDTRNSVEFSGRSYRDYNKQQFENKLLEAKWEDFYNIQDPNEAWLFIKHNVEKALDIMCPMRTFHIKNYRPEWMTNELIEQIKDRDYFFQKAKKSGDEDAWNIAKYLRNTTNSNIRQAKREFVLDELKQNEKNPKKFWKVIREVIPSYKSNSHKNFLLKDSGVKLGKENVAGFINDYFVNVGNVDPPGAEITENTVLKGLSSPSPIDNNLNEKSLEKFNRTEVLRIIKDINVSKSSGLDNISSFIIKEAFQILLPEVTHLNNLSIEKSNFPSAWKLALVIPIPKTGDLTNVKNYRPISLFPLPGKILEKLVHKQLTDFLDGESLLIEEQHGFRRNHSTIHSVAQLANYVNLKMDSKMCTLATYIDFKKAFDCVQHPVLLGKLGGLRLSGSVIDWATSYLSGRSQKVLANGTCSTTLPITQGVPQGSVLGPLFYIIYANDLIQTVQNCEIALYADDTVLFTANKSFPSSVRKMQTDLDSLSHWCKINGIKVNTDKSKVMVFGSTASLDKLPDYMLHIDEAPLQIVNSYRYLGITLDQKLNYNLHVNRIVSSVSAKLKQFQRMRSFLSAKAAILVYKGTILPLLEYGDVFLNAATVESRKKLQV